MPYSQVKVRREALKERPIVILDEFISRGILPNAILENQVRLMRNAFRALDIIVIVMGTDTHASNILNVGLVSRMDTNEFTWCYVVSELPPYDPTYLQTVLEPVFDSHSAVVTLLRGLISQSRPLFATFAVKWFEGGLMRQTQSFPSMLDSLFGHVGLLSGSAKRLFDPRDIRGIRGQLLLYFNYSYSSGNESHVNDLIGKHFAKLNEPPVFCLSQFMYKYDSADAVGQLSGATWKPRCRFPRLDEDPLMFLSLSGGPHFHPFNGRRISTVVQELSATAERSGLFVKFDNANQITNDGMQLEAISIANVILSSHAHGIAGIACGPFIQHLLYNVQSTIVSADLVSVPNVVLNALQAFVVPFYGPPDVSWPNFMAQTADLGLRVGSISRPPNMKRVDMLADIYKDGILLPDGLTGEAKDRNSMLSLPVVKNILLRIPLTSKLHLVFTNEIQNTYFARGMSMQQKIEMNSPYALRPRNHTSVSQSVYIDDSDEETDEGDETNNPQPETIYSWINSLKKSDEEKEFLKGLLCLHVEDGRFREISGFPVPQVISCVVLFICVAKTL